MNSTRFQCPVCALPLWEEEKRYRCPKQHSFDKARKGYVNLLLPHHTGSRSPGDDKTMLRSRRRILERGFYRLFSDQLNLAAAANLPQQPSDAVGILDAGCGEGYYTQQLKNRLGLVLQADQLDLYGTDISKAAINYAASRDRKIRFAVASTYHLPFLTKSLDLILCVFAPRQDEQFWRVLKDNGRLIVAAPGPNHLRSLRRILYDSPEDIGPRGTVDAGFSLADDHRVSYQIHLENSADIFDLVTMTPYNRHVDEAGLEKLRHLPGLNTEIDVRILVYQKV